MQRLASWRRQWPPVAACIGSPGCHLRYLQRLTSTLGSPRPVTPPLRFEILHESTQSMARVGRIHLANADPIDTPTFVPVATQAAIKGLDIQAKVAQDTDLMFCNTYHLMLMPGVDVVDAAGGLKKFTGRRRAIITDSGGFQVFSLQAGEMELTGELKGAGGKRRPNLVLGVDEEGVTFRSYLDGKVVHLTPESSVQAQKLLGADIIIPLDELLPYSANETQLLGSLNRTHRWEVRSLREHLRDRRGQAMYAVIHGGINTELRVKSLNFLSQLPFDGLAIGGSLGQDKLQMASMLQQLTPKMPHYLPRHLLGIGDMDSIRNSVPLGIDSFDSCYPTRLARHGSAVTVNGAKLDLRQGRYALDFTNPLDPDCDCDTCRNYSKGYLRHLLKARESSGGQLITQHNIRAMSILMSNIRERILADEI